MRFPLFKMLSSFDFGQKEKTHRVKVSLRFPPFGFTVLCVSYENFMVASAQIHRPYPNGGKTACFVPVQAITDVALQIDAACVRLDGRVPAAGRRAVKR